MRENLPARISRALRPFRGSELFHELQNEINHVLSRFSGLSDGGEFTIGFSPSVDLSETDDSVQVRMDLPGMKSDDIDIQVNGESLRVSGERKEEKEEKGKSYHYVERRSGSFSRSIPLPCAVEAGKVNAEYHDGVLTVKLPKASESKTQKIAVKSS